LIDRAGRPHPPTNPHTAYLVSRGAGPRPPAAWQTLTLIPTFWFRSTAGVNHTDRVELILPESAARDAWLEVTVRANARTGLTAPDVFYFGNLVGDTGNDRGAPVVNAADVQATLRALGKTDAASLSRFDFNRDGKINAADVLIVRNNLGHALPPFPAPSAPAPAATFDTVPIPSPARAPARPRRRGVLDPTDLAVLA
jgi:hypothetical protein